MDDEWTPGYLRPLDKLGRVVIPWDIREEFGWGPYTKLAIRQTPRGVFLSASRKYCTICLQGPEPEDSRWIHLHGAPYTDKHGKNEVQDERVVCPSCALKLSDRIIDALVMREATP